jgi:hypothetical protein
MPPSAARPPLPPSASGAPALGRTSMQSYLSRDEVDAQAVAGLQSRVRCAGCRETGQLAPKCAEVSTDVQRAIPLPRLCAPLTRSQRLARVSADPAVQASAKATLRKEAAEVRGAVRSQVRSWQRFCKVANMVGACLPHAASPQHLQVHQLRSVPSEDLMPQVSLPGVAAPRETGWMLLQFIWRTHSRNATPHAQIAAGKRAVL